ncbi:MAG: DUF1674 domain-containing protein [Beijerinckiaceae bacterium]
MNDSPPVPPKTLPQKTLSAAALRALAEAAERRKQQAEKEQTLATSREVNGRGGKDPVRYNDWEIKGLTSDF